MTKRLYHILRATFILLAIILAVPAVAQNTKGDRPVDNQRKVRETKGKSVKKKSKATTRDVAGRRLRTKNKSSANRANVGIRQPETTSQQPRRITDRAASVPANKRWASKEKRRSDPDRSWQGDISGSKPRRVEPKGGEESGRNVYPQRKYATRQPKGKPLFKDYPKQTAASGRPVVKRPPHRTERAWKGDIEGNPFVPPSSLSGSFRHKYNPKGKNVKLASRRPTGKDRSFNNKNEVAIARAMGSDMSPKKWGNRSSVTPTGSAPYVTRGKKNVYWGKIKIRERAKTRDLAGKPLSRRNFQSSGIGLTGRDTLAFFGRKPHGDVMGRGKNRKYLPGSERKGGWLNDLAGYRLRKRTPQGGQPTKGFLGFRSLSGKLRDNSRVAGKAPGIGAGAIARDLKRTDGTAGKNFGDQGGSFTGYLKAKKQYKFKGGAGYALWNNNRTPINGKALPSSAGRAGKFSGNLKGSGKAFGDQGGSYTGYLKTRKIPASARLAGKFSGRLKGSGKAFQDQGGSYTGALKVKPKGFNDQGGSFTGYLKVKPRDFNDQGGSYTGYLKAQKPHKFAGSKSGGLWNNNGKAVTELETTKGATMAGNFQGRNKTRRPDKTKIMATPNVLWNNDGKATTMVGTSKTGAAAGLYTGRMKAKEPKKYPLNSTHTVWNNDGKATTDLKVSKAAARTGAFTGNTKYKKESKDRDTEIEDRMKVKKQYTQSPHSVEEATKKEKLPWNYKTGTFASGAKVSGKRKHHPNSDDEAIDGMYHASARRVDYQGNVKMRKFFDRKGESPDARFVNPGENNVKEDRTIMTNVKLLWARLFQKSESQPANLKERSNKLRYDKREKGMWND